MAKQGKPAVDQATLELYAQLVATHPKVELKGATLPYTAVNGNMFSMIGSLGQVALRLPAKERAAFLTRYATNLQEEHGVVREEYVLVPAALLARTSELAKHFAVSHAYAQSLPAKPTTRKQAAAATRKASTTTRKKKRS